MKKLSMFFLILLLASQVRAGDDEKDRPNGFRIGYVWSNLTKSGENAADNLDGLYAGFVRSMKLAPLFKFETGMEFCMNGAKQTENSKLQLGYLVLPAQVKAQLGPLVGQVGVNGNFRILQKFTVNGNSVDIDDSNRAAFFDLAVNAGAGFNILALTIEARYYWGLIDVRDGWYNRYAQLGLKINF
jgi:hypothetical protein